MTEKYSACIAESSIGNAAVVEMPGVDCGAGDSVSLGDIRADAWRADISLASSTGSESMEHQPQRHSFPLATLRDCLEASEFIERQRRKLEIEEALEDAFESGGQVFDDAFWTEVKKRRAS